MYAGGDIFINDSRGANYLVITFSCNSICTIERPDTLSISRNFTVSYDEDIDVLSGKKEHLVQQRESKVTFCDTRECAYSTLPVEVSKLYKREELKRIFFFPNTTNRLANKGGSAVKRTPCIAGALPLTKRYH